MKKVLEVIKKNLVSVICVAVALLAVGAIFWPISGKYDDLQKDVNDRVQVYSDLQKLSNKKRLTPRIPGLAEQGNLAQFPTQPVIDAWTAVADQVKKESSSMFDAVVAMNTHEPLMPNVLPTWTRTYDASQFRSKYRSEMDLSNEETRPQSIVHIVDAGFFPSNAAIAAEVAKVEVKMRSEAISDPVTHNPVNPNFQQDLAAAQLKVPDQLKAEVADHCKMYVEPTALDASADIMNTGNLAAPEPSQIFIAQMGYWIQRDVLQKLADANKGATNVKDASVKHLYKIRIDPGSWAPFTASSPAQDAPPPPPADAAASGDWKLTSYTTTPTGRVNNGVYDVFHFGMSIVVDADQVGNIIRELSRNKLINVTQCDVTSRDSAEAEMRGYYYGSKPVVQLEMNCEALMLRKWTEPLMPDGIRKALGLKPLSAATPAAG